MELKDFIKNSIISITEGINEGHGYIVKNDLGNGIVKNIKNVSFNIEITNVSDNKITDGEKVNIINVLSINSDYTTYQNVSHISFDVQIDTNGFTID